MSIDQHPAVDRLGLSAAIAAVDLPDKRISNSAAEQIADILLDGYLNFEVRVELHEGIEEWSALYVDGKLYSYGDTYNQDEALRYKLFPITHVDERDWLQADNRTPYHTLVEVAAAREGRLDIESKAKALRDRAAALVAEADELEASQ